MKKLKKLRPSGVICSILVDPDASSEEEVFAGKGPSQRPSKMEMEAIEEQKRQKKEAARVKEK